MYFSKSTLGFYDNPKNYKNAPDDLKEITDDTYNFVCANRPIGKILSTDENGHPILIDPTQKTKSQIKREELQSLATVFDENIKLLDIAWLSAARADGVNEDTRKNAVLTDVADLQAQYNADCAAVRAKYA